MGGSPVDAAADTLLLASFSLTCGARIVLHVDSIYGVQYNMVVVSSC